MTWHGSYAKVNMEQKDEHHRRRDLIHLPYPAGHLSPLHAPPTPKKKLTLPFGSKETCISNSVLLSPIAIYTVF